MKNNLVSFLNHRLIVLHKLRRKCGDKQFKLLATGLLTSKIVFGISYYGQTTEVLRDKVRMIMKWSLGAHWRSQLFYEASPAFP